MIHIKARLLLENNAEELLQKTLNEFTRCCQWVHERAPVDALDMHLLRKMLYNQVRHQTELSGVLCSLVFSVVSSYRKAVVDMAAVHGELRPEKLMYYDNGLSIKNRQISLCLLGGRKTLDYDVEKPSDYRLLKSAVLHRADLRRHPDYWGLEFFMKPTEIVYTPSSISYEKVGSV